MDDESLKNHSQIARLGDVSMYGGFLDSPLFFGRRLHTRSADVGESFNVASSIPVHAIGDNSMFRKL